MKDISQLRQHHRSRMSLSRDSHDRDSPRSLPLQARGEDATFLASGSIIGFCVFWIVSFALSYIWPRRWRMSRRNVIARLY